MRKALLLVGMAATLGASAAQLTPEAALRRAVAEPHVKAMVKPLTVHHNPELVYTEEINAQPAAYLFDRGNGAGYLIVSADDEVVPLLGYSDAGCIDVADMPDGLRYWLGYYAAEIENVRTSGTVSALAATSPERRAIAPMLTTRWNQSAPYNNMCPTVGSNRCVTGCVATALAQVMKYHNWPAKGRGSNSYTWNNTTLSLDFSTVTYDWANMLDEYGSTATATQNAAVANLMYSCGIAVNMSYGTGASGAVSKYCGSALVDYFNYDASLRYLERDFYTISDWEDEVYNSLASGCPVLYGGQSATGGHEFVCDGYSSDGYFHFNWGWGGMSDGYFRLTALNPGAQGIGGAGSGAGYNFGQDIIVGIKPYAGQSAFTPVLANRADFTISETSVRLPGSITASAQVRNISYGTVDFKLGVGITGADGNTVYSAWSYTNTLSLQPGYGYTSPMSYSVSLPSGLADGVYTVAPAFIADGKWYDIETLLGCAGSVKMTVANGVATFAATAAAALPEVTEYSFVNTLYSGLPYTVNGTVVNSGELEFYDTVYGMLITSSGNTLLSPMQLDIEPGQTLSFGYSGTIPSDTASGTCQFAFVVRTSDNSYTPISDITDIVIMPAPASTQLSLGPVSFESGSSRVPKNDLGVRTSLTCTSGAYYGTLNMVVFRNVSGNQWSSCAEFPSEMLYLDKGDTADIVYHSDFSSGNVGETYLLMFYYGNNRFNTQQMIVLDEASGASPVVADSEVDIEIYNLNGQRVAGRPAPGHYIMVKRAADGTATSEHLVVK
ncbi:MAG: C10 family peptidase [Muribaculaceae bacterium]|nr:C10 family peptidase [Muribaculaceae bacterium]